MGLAHPVYALYISIVYLIGLQYEKYGKHRALKKEFNHSLLKAINHYL